MTRGGRRSAAGAIAGAVIVFLGSLVSVAGQAGPPSGPQMSEAVFKNVQVLKGIPADEFMDAMGMFAASLGFDCVACHSQDIKSDRAAFAIETPLIRRARQMIAMMNSINETNFGGRQMVTCFTCHHSLNSPEPIPSLALQYGDVVDDPNSIRIATNPRLTPDQVFDRYLQALGGAQRVSARTSFIARGTYSGFNTSGNDAAIEIAAKAPNLRSESVRTLEGSSVKTYDGRTAWASEDWRPLPLMTLTGGNLEGAKVDAMTSFPATIRQGFVRWQAGSTTMDDHPVQILQGTNPGQNPVNFYFDQSGLLVRIVRWNKTAVGTVPTQIDYSDYRDVAGVKMPFRWLITWTNGQNTIVLIDVQPNVAIDAARFARPAPYQRR
jgi:photosynthetic reaction center cytochrome c subunit